MGICVSSKIKKKHVNFMIIITIYVSMNSHYISVFKSCVTLFQQYVENSCDLFRK